MKQTIKNAIRYVMDNPEDIVALFKIAVILWVGIMMLKELGWPF